MDYLFFPTQFIQVSTLHFPLLSVPTRASHLDLFAASGNTGQSDKLHGLYGSLDSRLFCLPHPLPIYPSITLFTCFSQFHINFICGLFATFPTEGQQSPSRENKCICKYYLFMFQDKHSAVRKKVSNMAT